MSRGGGRSTRERRARVRGTRGNRRIFQTFEDFFSQLDDGTELSFAAVFFVPTLVLSAVLVVMNWLQSIVYLAQGGLEHTSSQSQDEAFKEEGCAEGDRSVLALLT